MIINNPFVTGTLVVMATGSLIALLHQVPARTYRLIRDCLIFTVEIDNSDRSFMWTQAFIASMSRCRRLAAAVMPPASTMFGSPTISSRDVPKFYLAPRGTCTFKWNGRRFLAWVTKEKLDHSLEWRQTITLQCFRGNR